MVEGVLVEYEINVGLNNSTYLIFYEGSRLISAEILSCFGSVTTIETLFVFQSFEKRFGFRESTKVCIMPCNRLGT